MSIVAAIQYAVILGTNDRRPWDPAPNSSDILYKMMRRCTEDTPMRQRHEMIRKHCAERQIHLSVMSSIFSAQEAEITTPQSRFKASPYGLYVVSTRDLLALSNALNKMHAPRIGTLGHLSTDVQLAAAIEARPGRTFPTASNLLGPREAAMREEMRRSIERHRQLPGPRHASSESEDDDRDESYEGLETLGTGDSEFDRVFNQIERGQRRLRQLFQLKENVRQPSRPRRDVTLTPGLERPLGADDHEGFGDFDGSGGYCGPSNDGESPGRLPSYEPAASVSDTAGSVTGRPGVEEPVVSIPAVDSPGIEEPAVNIPAVSIPVVDSPVVEQSAVGVPVVENPVVEQPAVSNPVADESVVRGHVVSSAPASSASGL